MVSMHRRMFTSTDLINRTTIRVPPNVVFEVDDVESDWPSRKAFDFIHSRYMCGSIVDWPRLFKQAYKSGYTCPFFFTYTLSSIC